MINTLQRSKNYYYLLTSCYHNRLFNEVSFFYIISRGIKALTPDFKADSTCFYSVFYDQIEYQIILLALGSCV